MNKIVSKSEIRNVIHNAGYMMITQIALYVAPLFILSYLLKTLGVAQFGNYALILSIVAYLQIITDYGFSFSASRAISQNREDKEYISKIYLSTMTIKLAICAFLFLLLMLFLNLLPVQAELKQGILYGYLLVIGNTFQPQWFFQGIEKLKIIALSNVISRCAACLLVFIYVRNSEDLQKALLVQSLPLVISAIGLNIFILKYINIIFPEKKLFKVILKEGKDFFLASLYSVILNNSGIFLLGIFTNPVIVGVYAAAEKIVKAVLSLFTPLTQAIYPYNCRKFSLSVFDGIEAAKKTGIPIIILAFIAAVIVAITLPVAIDYLNFPKETIFVGQILSAWIFFGVLNNVFGIQILSASGRSKKYSRMVFVSALITLLLITLLLQFCNATGVACAILLGEMFLSILLLKRYKKII